MPWDTKLDLIRCATLINEGCCSEDDIRRAILSRKVKPLFHIDELSTPFMRWSEDGSALDDPIIDDESDKPYELFTGYVYLEINRTLGFLDCDFHRFTKATDADAGLCPLSQFSLVEHVSMDDVIRNGGLTKLDAELLEPAIFRTNANPSGKDASTKPEVATPANLRRDLLVPLIEAAQKELANPSDTAAVWAALQAMAAAGRRPLLGISEDGIKWTDANDELQFLTIKKLRDRLFRLSKKAR